MLALAGLMLLAFVPLFFAVASLTHATLVGYRQANARVLGRTIALHVATAREASEPLALERALRDDTAPGAAEALRVFDADGAELTQRGDAAELAGMPSPELPRREAAIFGAGPHGRVLDLTVPSGRSIVMVRMRLDDGSERAAPLVRLVALYMTTFALALLTFAYFVLTRLIVRPIDALVGAANRVANGSRTLAVPRAGAREVADLGESVQAMATALIADETAMRAKVDELTLATKRLTETKAQLVRSERMASVGRLAAGVAHEIGNPIAAIMGMEDLLLEGDLPAPDQQDFLRRMKQETERINVVLRDLLDFARPEAEESAETSAPLPPADVGDVMATVAALARPQKAFRSVTVETFLPKEPLYVALPAARLTQVLLNLVLNAGAAISSSADAGESKGTIVLRAAHDRERQRVRIEVEDNGPGVAPDLRERIFEPFVTTKDVGEGTGLGLAVCRGIAESAGGEVGVDTSYDRGARFFVTLPAPPEQSL